MISDVFPILALDLVYFRDDKDLLTRSMVTNPQLIIGIFMNLSYILDAVVYIGMDREIRKLLSEINTYVNPTQRNVTLPAVVYNARNNENVANIQARRRFWTN